MFIIPVNTFMEDAISDKKNVDISMGVSLLEKQNWYYGDYLGWLVLLLINPFWVI